jgi:hypothetical protein
MATNRVELCGSVDLDIHAVGGDEGSAKLVVERTGDVWRNPPLEDRQPLPGSHPLGRRGGGLMIRVPGDPPRLKHHQQVRPAEPVLHFAVENANRNVGQAAVGVVQQHDLAQPKHGSGGAQFARSQLGQIYGGSQGAGLAVGKT